MPACRSIPAAPDTSPWHGRELGRSCLVLATLLVAACSHSLHRSGNPAAGTAGTADTGTVSQTTAPGTALSDRLGTVHVIGTGRRFVLVETPSTRPVSTIVDGQALVCRAAGVVTSTLRVSHERRPPFVVADVASGEPQVGDEVFIDTVPGRVAIPAPADAVPPPPDSRSSAATPDFHTNPALPPPR